jgi:hypothetical protein
MLEWYRQSKTDLLEKKTSHNTTLSTTKPTRIIRGKNPGLQDLEDWHVPELYKNMQLLAQREQTPWLQKHAVDV